MDQIKPVPAAKAVSQPFTSAPIIQEIGGLEFELEASERSGKFGIGPIDRFLCRSGGVLRLPPSLVGGEHHCLATFTDSLHPLVGAPAFAGDIAIVPRGDEEDTHSDFSGKCEVCRPGAEAGDSFAGDFGEGSRWRRRAGMSARAECKARAKEARCPSVNACSAAWAIRGTR